MFPNHPAAKHYHCSSTKSSYLLCCSIAEVLFEEIKNDMIDVPQTAKFDEFTTSQVKKQLDIYVCYWSKIHDQDVNGYGGSCFIGDCTADDLLKHVQDLLKSLNLKEPFLLHVGMERLNVNLKFGKELAAVLKSVHDTGILRLGTCSLHLVRSAFKKGLEKLNFSFATLFNDLYFFFKLSSARREDYKDISEKTGITAEFVQMLGETRGLSMKLLGVVQNNGKIQNMIFQYLLKKDSFSSLVEKTEQYKKIKEHFKE